MTQPTHNTSPQLAQQLTNLARVKARDIASGVYSQWLDCLAAHIGGATAKRVVAARNKRPSDWSYVTSAIDGIADQPGLGQAILNQMAAAADPLTYYDKVYAAIRDCPTAASASGVLGDGGQPELKRSEAKNAPK
jgi:hypothetical protein